ncbi:DUF4238 domain-containing protein [Mesoplasma seiffertii]|uniref:DUF4238 domain-containing protein n=1 Tax=Mesoplasma seiffertii TaxID=28224 RepID=UPI00047CED53|nr:DUF4238 domain-containing protein [Mesoplasma seiffertii]
MEKKKVKRSQHYIPRFFIKNWITDGNVYNYYNKKENMNKKGNIKNPNNDIFQEHYFYENELLFFINEIENKLSQMENAASLVINKIINSRNNDFLSLSRKELVILKIYVLLQKIRSKSFKKKLDKNNETNVFLNDLNYLYEKIFFPIVKENKVFNKFEENFKDKYVNLNLKYLFKDTYLNIIHLDDSIEQGFVTSDLASCRFPNDQNMAFEFFPLSPKTAIVFVKTDNLSLPINIFARFSKSHAIAKEIFGGKYIDKNIEYKYINKDKDKNKFSLSNDDIFIYQVIIEQREYIVTILNFWLFNIKSNFILHSNDIFVVKNYFDKKLIHTILKGIFEVKKDKKIEISSWEKELYFDF